MDIHSLTKIRYLCELCSGFMQQKITNLKELPILKDEKIYVLFTRLDKWFWNNIINDYFGKIYEAHSILNKTWWQEFWKQVTMMFII
jgi:hypothetical protein